MAASLKLGTVPVPFEDEDGILIAEEGIVWGGALDGAGFGEFIDPVADVLRIIRALGGMVRA
jgi:hypothetical protein